MAYNKDVSEGYNAKIVSREGSNNFNYVEAPNASRMLGSIEGLRVLDLGCGSGRYSRWLKSSKNAAEVVGVDMSKDMIEHAREIEKKEPLGIHYHVGDASKPLDKDLGTFDVCFAGYLLHYSTDKDMLRGFLENIHGLLRKGGIFVTLNQDPDKDQNQPDIMPYGFTMTFQKFPPQEGDSITKTFYANGKYLCEFYNYYFKKGTYEELFEDTGFTNFVCEPYTIEDQDAKWNIWKQRAVCCVMKGIK